MTTPGPRPTAAPAFARRLKELTAGETQQQVAVRLGFTASYISQMQRGARPSREFVERLVEGYGLDREEWLRLAGIRPQVEEQEDERAAIARQAVEEVLRRTQAPPLDRIRANSREVTYDADLAEIRLDALIGQPIPPEDLRVAEDVLRALIAEERRRQGR